MPSCYPSVRYPNLYVEHITAPAGISAAGIILRSRASSQLRAREWPFVPSGVIFAHEKGGHKSAVMARMGARSCLAVEAGRPSVEHRVTNAGQSTAPRFVGTRHTGPRSCE